MTAATSLTPTGRKLQKQVENLPSPIPGKLYTWAFPNEVEMDVVNGNNVIIGSTKITDDNILFCIGRRSAIFLVDDIKYRTKLKRFGKADKERLYYRGFVFLLGDKRVHIDTNEAKLLIRVENEG